MDKNIFENPKIIIAISLLWGIGIALLFKNNCPNNCIVIKAPSTFTNDSLVFGGNRCFQLFRYDYPCVDEQ
jgi:hypothetical protein